MKFWYIKTNRSCNTPNLKRKTDLESRNIRRKNVSRIRGRMSWFTGTCGAKNYVGCDKTIDAPALPGTDRDTFMFTIYCWVKKCMFV